MKMHRTTTAFTGTAANFYIINKIGFGHGVFKILGVNECAKLQLRARTLAIKRKNPRKAGILKHISGLV